MIQYRLANNLTLSTIRLSECRQNNFKLPSDQPGQYFKISESRISEQLRIIPRLGGEERDRPDPQVSIRMKIIVIPSEEPRSNPSNIASVPEDERTKIIPAQHTIIMSCNNGFEHRGKIPQEDLWMDNKKFHPLGPQPRCVVEEDRVEAAVDMNPEAGIKVEAVTSLH